MNGCVANSCATTKTGSMPHRKAMRGTAQEHFPGKLIPKFGDVNWPPRSPELSPPGLKCRVCRNRPYTLNERKENIASDIEAIPMDFLVKVMRRMGTRTAECVTCQGGH